MLVLAGSSYGPAVVVGGGGFGAKGLLGGAAGGPPGPKRGAVGGAGPPCTPEGGGATGAKVGTVVGGGRGAVVGAGASWEAVGKACGGGPAVGGGGPAVGGGACWEAACCILAGGGPPGGAPRPSRLCCAGVPGGVNKLFGSRVKLVSVGAPGPALGVLTGGGPLLLLATAFLGGGLSREFGSMVNVLPDGPAGTEAFAAVRGGAVPPPLKPAVETTRPRAERSASLSGGDMRLFGSSVNVISEADICCDARAGMCGWCAVLVALAPPGAGRPFWGGGAVDASHLGCCVGGAAGCRLGEDSPQLWLMLRGFTRGGAEAWLRS